MTSSDGPRIPTNVAYAGYREHGYRGHKLYADLTGNETMSSTLGLAFRGTPFDENERAMLDDLATIVTVAEPRIWPLKLARIVASYGRSFAGFAAGNLALDGALIGVAGCSAVARSLSAVHANLERGLELREAASSFLEGRPIGFGVPFRPHDERVVNLTKAVERHGRASQPYWSTFTKVAELVSAERDVQPNIGIALAAVALDLGIRQNQVSLFALALAANCFYPNVQEAAEQRADALKNMPAEYVDYVGPEARESPRKANRDAGG